MCEHSNHPNLTLNDITEGITREDQDLATHMLKDDLYPILSAHEVNLHTKAVLLLFFCSFVAACEHNSLDPMMTLGAMTDKLHGARRKAAN